MRTKNKTDGQSFIEQARRAQIIGCAIDAIAEVGYAQASLALIGARAGISKGVITYHFASKTALMQAVVAEVFGQYAAFVSAAMRADTPWSIIHSFLQANAEFLKQQRHTLVALFELTQHTRQLGLDGYTPQHDITRLAAVLQEGQQLGHFRQFDPQIMATSILTLRNSLIVQALQNPQLAIDHYSAELCAMVERAIQHH